MNNKGFTLIEVLAVLVILSIITGLAIPAFSSSLEKNEEESITNNKTIFDSSVEVFFTDYKKEIYSTLDKEEKDSCYLNVSLLVDQGYVSRQISQSVCGEDILNCFVIFERPNQFDVKSNKDGYVSCIVDDVDEDDSVYESGDDLEGSDVSGE